MTAQARLRIFPAIPRNHIASEYIHELRSFAEFADQSGFAGILLFAGNDTLIETWSMAQYILMHTTRSSPLIAVNPAYMHPFTVAKFISSFAQFFERKVYLNMVTGTAISDLHGLGAQVSHEDRYSRLEEFIFIVRQLLLSRRLLTFEGKFYSVRNLQLRVAFPAALMPELLIAGESDDAKRVSAAAECLRMQMLPPALENELESGGVNMGILTRPSREEAWAAARVLFPESEENRAILQYSMRNTDSVWKRRLSAMGEKQEIGENGYWLGPFLNFQADCP